MLRFLAKGSQNRRPAKTEDRREGLVEMLLTMLVVEKSGGDPKLDRRARLVAGAREGHPAPQARQLSRRAK
jgi:hypothetical protein